MYFTWVRHCVVAQEEGSLFRSGGELVVNGGRCDGFGKGFQYGKFAKIFQRAKIQKTEKY